MFDVAPTELLLVAFVALVVIGPKDLPKAMRVVGYWVGRARGVARQFRSGFDAMVREAELEEMEKKWAAENERIMREHPPTAPADPALTPEPGVEGHEDGPRAAASPVTVADGHVDEHGAAEMPVTVEKPHVGPTPPDASSGHDRPGQVEGAAS